MPLRDYFNTPIKDLEALVESESTSDETLRKALDELTFRKTDRAKVLRTRLATRLGVPIPPSPVIERTRQPKSTSSRQQDLKPLLQISHLEVITDTRASPSDPPVMLEWVNNRVALAVNWESRHLPRDSDQVVVAAHVAHFAVDVVADWLAQRRNASLSARSLHQAKAQILSIIAAKIAHEMNRLRESR